MIEFRVRNSRSWLDAKYSKVLSYQLADRLVERCRGQKVLKIELTYRREEYSDPADLFYRAGDERHVRRFIEDLKGHLKMNLTGRWLCKMEFQHGGWVHWHLLLLGVSYINHAKLTDLWGHGYVWVRPAGESELRYVCKYIAKDGEFPAFLYLRPIRSVKIIRVSPGFWGNLQPKANRADSEDSEQCFDPEPEMPRLPVYVSVGEMIERGEQVIICRDPEGRYAQVQGDPWNLFGMLRRLGGKVTGSEKGWLQMKGIDLAQVHRLSMMMKYGLADDGKRGGTPGRRGGDPADGGRQAAALHLINSGNPPESPPSWSPQTSPAHRKWVRRVVEWQLGWRETGENQSGRLEAGLQRWSEAL